ncbi:HAD-IA family hydrolase [Lentisphaera profundi]|uniref:phosphoglycolate phosphatase n=1 Tax=Lentisphaera profundi TaxID=1658616 RepID=A0ABY7VUE5_9BACT|nr:HAD-IA family hydrolase [Lentisphaera profundi]WDE97815.1 HAD-IA family hydrolase [Lentisphaera profundi]
MKYKLLIFDLDGTLVDTRKDLAAAVNEMRRSYGLPILPLEIIVSYVGDGAQKLVERSLQGENVDPVEALKLMLDFYKKNICVFSHLYEGCRDFLKLMKSKGIAMAVLTNKPQAMTDIILKELDLDQYFNPILGPEGAGCHKPEPGGVYKCLEIHQIEAAQALMVGDHHTDLRVAQNAKIDNAFFTSGMGNKDGVIPTFVFDDYSSLEDKLQS